MLMPLFAIIKNSFPQLLLGFWSLRNILELFYLLALFQHKEYRLDRLRAHLTTYEGKKLFINLISLLKWFLIFLSFGLYFSEKYRLWFPYSVLIFFILEILLFIKKKIDLNFKRPIFTLRALLLIFSVLVFESVTIYFGKTTANYNLAVLTLLLDKSLPLQILLANFISLPLVKTLKVKAILQAKRKIRKYKHLIVVGITGSYGKTSTKHFLAEILKKKYKVFYTRGSNNTDIGVAIEILKGLKKDHEVFIVEMGAYRRGEIKAICDIVQPRIGVITAIGDQHLSLFGSKENIIKTKFELIDSLPNDGLAILNGDDREIVKKSADYSLKMIFYSLNGNADIQATNAILGKKHIRFKVIGDGEKEEFQLGALGVHNISNILAAVAVAKSLNFSLAEIAKATRKIQTLPHTMEGVRGQKGCFLIDDTFNANPAGVLAAIKYLAKTDWGKKILVMQPMIELGVAAREEHIRLGKMAGDVCDFVYFTNQDYKQYLQTGYKRSRKRAVMVWNKNRKEIAKEIKSKVTNKDVVLCEGKQAAIVLKMLKK